MIALADLTELNEADLRLDRLKADVAELDEQLGEAPWAVALKAEIEAQQVLVDDGSARRRDLEADLDARRAKIEAEDAKLYDGSISEPRELRNQQEAIYALRRGLKEAEDPALASMEAEEVQRSASDYLTKLRTESTAAWVETQSDVKDRRKVLKKQADTVGAEVEGWRTEISESDLDIYDAQRTKRPLAIAAVIGGVCGACRLALPTTILTRARRGTDPVFCPTCSCIVFVP